MTVTDGLVLGLLVGLTFPTLDLFFTAVLFGTAGAGLTFDAATALVLGPLAGATLGLGFWRQAALARVVSHRVAVAPVLAGVAAGSILGQFASPGGIGLSGMGGLDHPVLMLVFAVALTGAAGLTAGCAELLAGGGGRRSALPTTAAAIVVCTAAIWAGDEVQGLLDQGGWAALQLDIRTGLAAPLAVVAGLLASTLGLSAITGRNAIGHPAVAPDIRQILVTGVVAGLAAIAVTVVDGLRPSHVSAVVQSSLDGSWIAAATAVGASLALALAFRLRGWGAGLIAGPVAALIAATGDVGLVTLLRGELPTPAAATSVVVDGLGLGFAVTLTAAAVLPGGVALPRIRSTAAITACTTLLAATAALATAAVRDVPTAPGSVNAQRSAPPSTSQPIVRPTAASPLLTSDYKIIASVLADQYLRIQAEKTTPGAQQVSVHDQVARIDSRMIPDLTRLLDQAIAIRPADPTTAALHGRLIDALQMTITGYRLTAAAINDNSAASLASGRAELAAATQEFDIWSDTVRRL